MRQVVILDTSVLCHLLRVHNMCERHAEVLSEFNAMVVPARPGVTVTIPWVALVETGNHVAHQGDGQLRRGAAERFVALMGKALSNEIPIELYPFKHDRIQSLLNGYVDLAMKKVGLGDQSIIDAWNDVCFKLPDCRVRIWSFDSDLAGYDTHPG